MTRSAHLTLSVLDGEFTVAQLPPGSPLPGWATDGDLWAVVGAPGEVSVVTATRNVPDPLPDGLRVEGGWAALRLHGPFPFHLTGILAAVLNPLRDAGVGIFALSTFDTDYVLVKAGRLSDAVSALRAAGHAVGGA
ncbi:ACT domain-containing protein [Deinococcus aetherius]|uniref:ACT domain-containing protein n=1 Tax=Deinococcus aetherius TaxID=200252 RepID=A0ABN6RGA8_9DEIO|nr:ACT domain-containing protein [Deinococcus aetherius]BDP41694.1 ACT domain-containing protein [Deinococcus aetherius]